MTADKLRERLANLEEQQQAALAKLQACYGAIQECRYWLSQLSPDGPASSSVPSDGD